MMLKQECKLLVLLALSGTSVSCSHVPSEWSETLEGVVRCDMSLEEVRQLSSHQIVQEDVPRDNRTHYIRSGATDVWFVFEDDRLKKV